MHCLPWSSTEALGWLCPLLFASESRLGRISLRWRSLGLYRRRRRWPVRTYIGDEKNQPMFLSNCFRVIVLLGGQRRGLFEPRGLQPARQNCSAEQLCWGSQICSSKAKLEATTAAKNSFDTKASMFQTRQTPLTHGYLSQKGTPRNIENCSAGFANPPPEIC